MPSVITAARRPDIPALTSLRFFAALWVVLFHVYAVGLNRGGSKVYLAFILLGYLGVSFFFVLSGFILVYVYAGRQIQKRRFWQARFARIYPAYLFSLVVLIPALMSFWPATKRAHLTFLALTANPLLLEAWFPRLLFTWNPVGWSLSAEAFFYLVFPFAMPWLTALEWPRLRLALSGFWLTSLLITGTYVLLRPDGVAHPVMDDNQLFWLGVVKLNPLVRLPEFLLGMGTGFAFLRLPTRSRSWPIALGGGLLLLGVGLQRWIPFAMMHSGLLAPAFAVLIFGFATQPTWSRFLAAKPLILLGEASYSLYLLQGFFLFIALVRFGHSKNLLAVTVVSVVVAILGSIAAFLLIEKPLRRLLHPRYATPLVPVGGSGSVPAEVRI
jgi:peptidoglycan/LPS O-acetylase OafA/YrhL